MRNTVSIHAAYYTWLCDTVMIYLYEQ